MGFTTSFSESMSVSHGYSTHLSLPLQGPIEMPSRPPLTTVFTAPPECKTPFVYEAECYNPTECDGEYLPVLFTPLPGTQGYSSIQCCPEATTYSDGYIDAIQDFDPGIFCPDWATTAASTGSVFVCCPTGLTYSNDGGWEVCTGTMMPWTGPGLVGPWIPNQGTISKTISFSAADHKTLYILAHPIFLTAYGVTSSPISATRATKTTKGSNSDSTSSSTPTENAPKCRRDGCQTTTTTPPDVEAPTSASDLPDSDDTGSVSRTSTNITIGVTSAAAFILLALGGILLARYRWKRLRGRSPADYHPSTKFDGSDVDAAAQRAAGQEKLPPELPVTESRGELDGSPAEEGGAGIYTWKPELEGTPGAPGGPAALFVRKKSELEARESGLPSPVPGMGLGTMASDALVAGPSFTDPRYPVPTPRTLQMYI
ncbi:hypothetical protein F4802DRAFT_138902 [Xylaria palmicola]|nr:hypothetical protein F4802DRAFT_138902 [Xylaria palmicola]